MLRRRCCCVPSACRCQSISPTRMALSNKPAAHCGTERQTRRADGQVQLYTRPLHKPCSACFAGSANNDWWQWLWLQCALASDICKRRITFLSLPCVPPDLTDTDRQLFMSSVVPFDNACMVVLWPCIYCRGAECCDEHICGFLSVCLSLCKRISGTAHPDFTKCFLR